ncbi:MAG: PEP-CTERM sorting domain-containing protein [Tepidisphaeraceae bacterium]
MNRKTILLPAVVTLAAVMFAAAPLAMGQAYIAYPLYTPTASGYSGTAFSGGASPMPTFGGQTVGSCSSGPNYSNGGPLLWEAQGSVVELNPTGLSYFTGSGAYATDGAQQVGVANVYTWTSGSYAMFWTGSATSAVDLNPSTGFQFSAAYGVGGGQQVGDAWSVIPATGPTFTDAMLWAERGSKVIATDLNPTSSGYYNSRAWATDGIEQVGQANSSNGATHAMVWNGSAGNYADLNPAGFSGSVAYGVGGHQQVGMGFGTETGGAVHAMLWSGSATSGWEDLNPTGFGTSYAYGTNGSQEVGYGTLEQDSNPNALVWTSNNTITPGIAANSAIDLETAPSSTGTTWAATSSQAFSIDQFGDVFGIASGTYNNGSGNVTGTWAVEWAPVVSLVAAGGLTWNNTGGTSPSDGTTWDTSSNNNWNNGGSAATVYTDGSNVTFNDSNNGHHAVTLNTTVSPASVTVDNILDNYTISGTGSIDDSGSFVKSGSGTLTLGALSTALSVSAASISITGGSMQLVGGTTVTAGTINIDYGSSLSMSAGSLSVSGTGYAGYSGAGSFNQTGGTATFSGQDTNGNGLSIGDQTGGNGTYTLSSGTLTVSGNETVGNSGTGTFNQSGGTNTAGGLFLGQNTGGSGAYTLSGGSLSAELEYVGYRGTGTFDQSGGTNTIGELFLGLATGSSGAYTLSGGSLWVESEESVGLDDGSTGSFIQSGGTNTVYGGLNLPGSVGSSGTYDFQGGTLIASAISVYRGGLFEKTVGSGTSVIGCPFLNLGGTVQVDSGTLWFYSGFAQSEGVTKMEGGNLAGSFDFEGGSLEGSGSILGYVLNGATVKPGDSPGTITITGDYQQSSEGTLMIELAGGSPGQFDVLDVEGTASLDGILDISLLDDFIPTLGETFQVVDYGDLSGQFATVDVLGNSNVQFALEYNSNDLVLIATVVPEPASLALLAVGGLGFMKRPGRRSSK